MKIMRKPAVHIAFCAVVFTAVFATGTSDNPLTAENNLRDNCARWELSLNFSNTIISAIGKSFISSPLINCLSLEGNRIALVEEGAFDALPALEYLNMARNSIRALMPFGGHENLRVLILANQSVNPYSSNSQLLALTITGRYPKLHFLDLSGNHIYSIHWAMEYDTDYRNTSMQMYDVFPELTYLDLSYNYINEIVPNDQTFMLLSRNLTHLYLHGNNMQYGELTHLENLIILTLDDNRYKELRRNSCTTQSVCLGDTLMLKYLSISKNELTHIENNFFNAMPELVSLNLSGNRIYNSLHGMFDMLISLEDLNIDNNRLINVSISNRPLNLHSFSLNRNNIEYIDSNDLRNIPLLRKLYLNNNEIKGIHKNAFLESKLLEELHLANNHLTDLPADWSVSLRSLRYLDLTNNAFMYLESLSLSDTVPLIDIDLINNQLISLKATTFHGLPENVTIYLTHNQRKKKVGTSVCEDC